jgi:hypothetical protein
VRVPFALLTAVLIGQAAAQPALQWYRLGGMIIDSHGRPPLPGRASVSLSGPTGSESVAIDESGQFEFIVPVPADYRLHVSIHSLDDRTLVEYATREFKLGSGAAIPFVIVTKPAVRLAGHVTLEGAPRQPSESMTVTATDASGAGSPWIEPADVDDEGSFVFPAYAGAHLLRPVGAAMRGRSLKAILCNGADVTDVPKEFSASDRVEVAVTSRISLLQGTVTTSSGAIAEMAQVFLVGEDPAAWIPHSSRVYVTRAGRDGRYGIRGIRPGRYLVAAIPFQETVFPFDAPRDLLAKIARIATAIPIGDGETRVADLTQQPFDDGRRLPPR